MTGYSPMTLSNLANRLTRTADPKVQWKLVWEFLEEYRWEPDEAQFSLLRDVPAPIGDDRWDALLAGACARASARAARVSNGNQNCRSVRRSAHSGEPPVQTASFQSFRHSTASPGLSNVLDLSL
jgi:hypothetical protein